nr:hypothetical protein Itr_chr03CG01200 [Ipomoea trifida]
MGCSRGYDDELTWSLSQDGENEGEDDLSNMDDHIIISTAVTRWRLLIDHIFNQVMPENGGSLELRDLIPACFTNGSRLELANVLEIGSTPIL